MWWEAVPAFVVMTTCLSLPWWLAQPFVKLTTGCNHQKEKKNRHEVMNNLRDERLSGSRYKQLTLREWTFEDAASQ